MSFTSEERVNIRSALSSALDQYITASKTGATEKSRAYWWQRVEETRAAIQAFEREVYSAD